MAFERANQSASKYNPYSQQKENHQNPHQQQQVEHDRMSPGVQTNNHGARGSLRRIEEEEHIARATIHPTPLFERLVTEEVQEMKAYGRIIENQNRRVAELERVHGDLEARLEQESRGRQQLEATLDKRERQWSDKFKQLASDRDHWKEVVEREQLKNSRLIDQIYRKDQDIHRMLQRKYDHQRDGNHFHAIRNLRPPHADRHERANTTSRSPENRSEQHKSPHEILQDSGSIDAIRLRSVTNMLFEFFSM